MIERKNYTIENYHTEVSVDEYKKECVNVEEFLECCKACRNYDKVWSCPSYDFSSYDYWDQFKTLYIYGRKILFSEELRKKNYSPEEVMHLTETLLETEKRDMAEELLAMEKEYPGSVSLSAGSCLICGNGNCTRPSGKPCRFPEKMRYSLESLGGNVGLTITKYLHLELLWLEQGKLPDYFILVAGLLKQ